MTEVILAVSYQSEVLEEYLNDKAKQVLFIMNNDDNNIMRCFQLGIRIIFSKEDEPLGTGQPS